MLASLVCEQYDLHDEALTYVAVVHDLDPNLGGDFKPTSHILTYCVKGRILARRGELQQASAAFEAAVAHAEELELWLLTAFASRDMKLFVLDGMGHGEYASQRLGAALRRLKGPAEQLNAVLDGLDAAELMALAPPDADYRVVYVDSPSEDPAASALRQELGSLRMKELRKRAEGAGVSEDELEDVIDSDEPKATLINLLVEILTTSSKNDQDLRSELEGLRLKELRTRAKRANIEQDDVDDAVDSDDPKAAMVELLLWHTPDAAGASTLSSDKPHFG